MAVGNVDPRRPARAAAALLDPSVAGHRHLLQERKMLEKLLIRRVPLLFDQFDAAKRERARSVTSCSVKG